MKCFNRTSGDLDGTVTVAPTVALYMQCFSLGIIWDLHNFKACGPLKIGKNMLRKDGPSEIFKWLHLK